jgi:tight adherence protein B
MTVLVAGAIIVSLLCGRTALRRQRADAVSRRLAHGAHRHTQQSGVALRRMGRHEVVWLGLSMTVVFVLRVPPIGVLVVGTAVAILTWLVLPRWHRTRRIRRAHAQLPDALDAVASSLRRGSSLLGALDASANTVPSPLREVVMTVTARSRHLGVQAAFSRDVSPEVTPIAAAMRVAAAADADATVVMHSAARSIRARMALDAEVQALVAQARLSVAVMVATPIAFCALLVLGDRGARSFLVHAPAGWVCAGVGIALDLIGWFWLRSTTIGRTR